MTLTDEQLDQVERGDVLPFTDEERRELVRGYRISLLRTERPSIPRVPPEVVFVQWSPVAGALVKCEGPFAIIDGACGKYRLVREGGG